MRPHAEFDPERRRFLGSAVIAAVALPGATSLAEAALAAPQPQPPATAPPQEGQPPQPSALAKHLAAAMRERYKGAIDESRMAEIEQGIESNLQTAAALAKVRIDNGEEPAFVFSAMRP